MRDGETLINNNILYTKQDVLNKKIINTYLYIESNITTSLYVKKKKK